jgi:hypothetical protein
MIPVNTQFPILLTRRGVNDKVTPVVKAQKLSDDNNNKRNFDEQKKRNVETTAVILRISKQRQS